VSGWLWKREGMKDWIGAGQRLGEKEGEVRADFILTLIVGTRGKNKRRRVFTCMHLHFFQKRKKRSPQKT